MRIKQLWSILPVPSNLAIFWERVTLSRVTTLYFVFSVVHCFIQLVFQIQAFMINAEAAATLYQITFQGNATNAGFPVLGRDLRICSTVPRSQNANSCPVFWDGTPGTENAWNSALSGADTSASVDLDSSATSSVASSLFSSSTSAAFSLLATGAPRTVTVFALPSATSPLTATPTAVAHISTTTNLGHQGGSGDDDLTKRDSLGGVNVQSFQVGGTTKVTVNGSGFSKPAVLERSCIFALNYPVAILQNTKREDLVFVAFQLWVLGMSTVALLHESIPHIIASLLTHVLASAWAAFQIVHTAHFREDFSRLTTEGACKPINLLPSYWKLRRGAELPILVLNIVALFISAFLTQKLVKLFGWQTFKRVGASLTMHRIYKTMLFLSITLQLSLFFMVVTTALWIDQLYNGSIGRLAKKRSLYKVLFINTLILLIPWLMTGWFAVRREWKIPMMIFLILSIAYLAGLGFMFVSDTFRWTFMEWRFFSLVALASVVLTALAFVLGVICRINFGKGLPRYLNAEEALPGDDFEPAYPSDIEKLDFPTNTKALPTFSATFKPTPSTSQTAVGSDSVEAKRDMSPVTVPLKVHMRSPSEESSLSRSASERTYKTLGNNSDTPSHSRANSNGSQASSGWSPTKRWVIE